MFSPTLSSKLYFLTRYQIERIVAEHIKFADGQIKVDLAAVEA